MREKNAPMVRLSYMDGMNDGDFDQLVDTIRAHGVSRPSLLTSWSRRPHTLTVRNCDVGEPGATSPCAPWQRPHLCCIPGRRDPEPTDAANAAKGPHGSTQR